MSSSLKAIGVLAHSCNLATESLELLGCVRLEGHIPLSEGWTIVSALLSLRMILQHLVLVKLRVPSKGPLSGLALGVSDI